MTHTADLSDEFFDELIMVAQRLGTDPLWLLQVMMAESGVRSNARNPISSATGLIQWMHDHWQAYGFTRDQFSSLSAVEQLKYVEMYFRPYKGKLVNVTAVYCAVFMPAIIGSATSPMEVISGYHGPRAWAYSANKNLDRENKGFITVGDLTRAVMVHCSGPRWAEIVSRLEQKRGKGVDVWTIRGVQERLKTLGFDPGAADGILGPKTKAAVVSFQQSRGLDADGIIGPITRAALLAG